MPQFSELRILLERYFPQSLDSQKLEQFNIAFESIVEWNQKINLISRNDVENLAERHFLHSLALLLFARPRKGSRILDIGTGGGFPGIPLAIMLQDVNFHLVDSIGKKIRVVGEIVAKCGLTNVQFSVQRAEEMEGGFDYVTGRAVSDLQKFIGYARKLVKCPGLEEPENGVFYYKGLDPDLELLTKSAGKVRKWNIGEVINEPFFSGKYLVHAPLCK